VPGGTGLGTTDGTPRIPERPAGSSAVRRPDHRNRQHQLAPVRHRPMQMSSRSAGPTQGLARVLVDRPRGMSTSDRQLAVGRGRDASRTKPGVVVGDRESELAAVPGRGPGAGKMCDSSRAERRARGDSMAWLGGTQFSGQSSVANSQRGAWVTRRSPEGSDARAPAGDPTAERTSVNGGRSPAADDTGCRVLGSGRGLLGAANS
jgi:hypothetical protein